MIVVVKKPFVGHGFNMPNPGELLDVPDDTARNLMSIQVVDRYEMKIDPLPPEVKKKEPGESSQVDRAQPRKTRKKSRKSATK